MTEAPFELRIQVLLTANVLLKPRPPSCRTGTASPSSSLSLFRSRGRKKDEIIRPCARHKARPQNLENPSYTRHFEQNNLYKKFFPLYGAPKRGCTAEKGRHLLHRHKVGISYRGGEELMLRERESRLRTH